jgi:hypothetical protein
MITRRPISPDMVEACARTLWEMDEGRDTRVPWDSAPFGSTDPFIRRATLVLETAMPLEREPLTALRDEITAVLEIL